MPPVHNLSFDLSGWAALTDGAKIRCTVSADAEDGMAPLTPPRLKYRCAAFPRIPV